MGRRAHGACVCEIDVSAMIGAFGRHYIPYLQPARRNSDVNCADSTQMEGATRKIGSPSHVAQNVLQGKATLGPHLRLLQLRNQKMGLLNKLLDQAGGFMVATRFRMS